MGSLGKTGIEFPPLVFGATTLGNLFQAVSDADKSALVQAWFDSTAGQQSGSPNARSPVVIDSAGKYGAGMSLEVIGHELSMMGISQEDVLISNKLGWRRIPMQGDVPSFEPEVWFDLEYDAVQDINREGILRCWEEGNQLLGGYHAQLVSVHDPDEYLAAAVDRSDRDSRVRDLVEAYEALNELKSAGVVAAIGIGSKTWQTIEELMGHCDFDWVMLANSFTLLSHPVELLDFLARLNKQRIGVVNSALFHGGFLLGGPFFDYRSIKESDASDLRRLDYRKRLFELCRVHCVSPFEAGLQFGKAHPAVDAVALSTSKAARVREQVTALEATPNREFWREMKQHGLISDAIDFL